MSLQEEIRDLQDATLNSGWRIKRIPWLPPGKLETVYNTPLTLVMGLGGAVSFLVVFGGILLMGAGILPQIKHEGSPTRVYLVMGIGLLGLVSMFLSRFVATKQKYSGWIKVQATRQDSEIRLGWIFNGKQRCDSWEYRLQCDFEHQGQHYTVTPQTMHLTVFKTQEQLEAFLDQRIDSDGSCTLWIDPRNPLHTCFHEKPRI